MYTVYTQPAITTKKATKLKAHNNDVADGDDGEK